MNINERIVYNHYEFYRYLGASSFRKLGEDKIKWIDASPSSWPKLVFDVQDDSKMTVNDVDEIVLQMEKKEIPSLWILNDKQEANTCKLLENHQLRLIRDWPGMSMDKAKFQDDISISSSEVKQVNSLSDLQIWLTIFNTVFNEKVDRKLMLSFLYDSNVFMYTGFHQDEPSATALGFVTNNTVGIYMLGVLPTTRKSGLARKLVCKIMQETFQHKVDLAVCSAMIDGVEFWKKMGYEQHSTFKIYWKLGEDYK